METYAVVRAHGLVQHLLRAEDYKALLEGKPLWELPEYAHIEPSDELGEVLSKIDRVFLRRVDFLESIGGGCAEFVRAFADRVEVGNIKVRLRELSGKRGVHDVYVRYSHHVDLEALRKAESEQELWALLERTPYHTALATEDVVKAPLELKEAYLDACYYAYLRGSLHRHDRKRLGRLIDLEALVQTLYWSAVMSGDRVSELMSRGQALSGLRPEFIRLEEEGVRGYAAALGLKWEEVRRRIEEGRVTELLYDASRVHLSTAAEEARRRQLSPVYLYYYLLLCKYERDNLQRVVVGIAMNLDREKIRQTLVLPPWP